MNAVGCGQEFISCGDRGGARRRVFTARCLVSGPLAGSVASSPRDRSPNAALPVTENDLQRWDLLVAFRRAGPVVVGPAPARPVRRLAEVVSVWAAFPMASIGLGHDGGIDPGFGARAAAGTATQSPTTQKAPTDYPAAGKTEGRALAETGAVATASRRSAGAARRFLASPADPCHAAVAMPNTGGWGACGRVQSTTDDGAPKRFRKNQD
jgi:hypothetical protein